MLEAFLGLIFAERIQSLSDAMVSANNDFAKLQQNIHVLHTVVLKDYFEDTTVPPPDVPSDFFEQPSCYNMFMTIPSSSIGISMSCERLYS